MKQQFNPNWPMPVETTREHPTRDQVSLSKLDTEEKRQAFERLKEEEPGMADFVSRMHKTFGKSELFVDEATAERLGVKQQQ